MQVFSSLLPCILIFCATTATSISAQQNTDPIPECGLGPWQTCRYIDPVTSAPVTGADFQLADPFYEGLAAVRVDGLFGFVDKSGVVVIPPQFEQVSQFRSGLAEVSDGTGVDLIDRNGRIVLATSFRRAIPISANVVMAYEDDREAASEWESSKYYLSPALWKEPAEEPVFVYSRAGLYDLDKGWMPTPPVRSMQLIPDVTGAFWLQVAEAGDDWELYDWGLMGADGQWIIGPGIMDVLPLPGGLSLVFDPPKGTKREYHDSSFGWEMDRNHSGWEAVVDAKGRMLAGGYFQDVGYSVDLTPLVLKDGRWFEIDSSGSLSEFAGKPERHISSRHRPRERPLVLTVRRAPGPDSLNCGNGVTLFSEPAIEASNSGAPVSPFDFRWGLKALDGRIMVPAEHRYITCPQDGIALVPDTAKGAWCPVGPHPQILTSSNCQQGLWDGWIVELARHAELDPDPFESDVKWWQRQLLWSQFPDIVDEPPWVGQ